MRTLGFIGVGTIASAFIAGLRHTGNTDAILLSPRSDAVSRGLAGRFVDVTRAASNDEVSEASDVVFLAMRPAQVEEALDGVRFRPGQTIASFVTGLSVPDLAAIAPAATVARILPLPMIVRGKGPVICFPPIETLVSLLSGMGDVVVPESEAELRAMGGVSGFMSSFFELEQSLADWLTGQGVPARNANLYVRSMIAGLAETGHGTAFEHLPGLPAEHETKGGLNARTRRYLKESGWFGAPELAFAAIQQIDRRNLK